MSPAFSDKFASFLAYWTSLRRGVEVPRLSDYLDHAPADIQPWLGLVDTGSDTFQRIRLMGTGLINYFGVDATGENYLQLLSEQALPIILRVHDEVPRKPCASFLEGTCSTSTGREVEMCGLALPLIAVTGTACVAWFLSPLGVLGFGERGLQIKVISGGDWIDLGNGLPHQPLQFASVTDAI